MKRSELVSHRAIGSMGEQKAVAYLLGLGWKIRATNFRCPHGEIDIVAEEPIGAESTLVFVEVKTRRSQKVSGLEAVGQRKQERLRNVALAYLTDWTEREDKQEPTFRFDVVEVLVFPDETYQITLHRGVF